MAIQRMDNVLIVVEDLDAFFVELGMELEGKGPLDWRGAERVIGLDDVRQDVAMLRIPDGPGRIELAKFHGRRPSPPSRKTHRRTRWVSVASCSPSTTSTMSSPACATTAPNSSVRWCDTRTSIGSVTSVAPVHVWRNVPFEQVVTTGNHVETEFDNTVYGLSERVVVVGYECPVLAVTIDPTP
ncbi:hypothetical protein ACIBEK_13755 [Nocardia fusca]|uniref:hypothetical protein n=1 Tax=Nocardia fusca TaxID=941183 RepID=UPI0037AC35C4